MGSIEKKAVVAFGHFANGGRKLYCSLLEIVGESDDIKKYFEKVKTLKVGEALIASAEANVSKKGKSYYRLMFHSGKEGLSFKFIKKLFPGMKVVYRIGTPPFIDSLRIVEDKV